MDLEPAPRQNITLALSKDLLQKAKRIAVKLRKSISGLLTEMFEDLVSSEEEYCQARNRQLALLERGLDLGTGGQESWTRDELHERSSISRSAPPGAGAFDSGESGRAADSEKALEELGFGEEAN